MLRILRDAERAELSSVLSTDISAELSTPNSVPRTQCPCFLGLVKLAPPPLAFVGEWLDDLDFLGITIIPGGRGRASSVLSPSLGARGRLDDGDVESLSEVSTWR